MGVYDNFCDDAGKYYLCKPAPLGDSSNGSCVYAVKGSYAFMHICMYVLFFMHGYTYV